MKTDTKYKLIIATFVAALVIIMLMSLIIGRYNIGVSDLFRTLASKPGDSADDAIITKVIWEIRFPRMLLAIFVGAGLSISGAAFQGCFHNPLVSPDMLGVSAGAGFGAALGIILTSATNGLTSVMAFGCGLASVFITWTISKIRKETNTLSLILAGVIVSALFNALLSFVKIIADTESELPAITFWLMGSLSGTTIKSLIVVAIPIIIGTAILITLRWRVNILTFGDEESRSLGVSPHRTKLAVIIAATMITASAIMGSGRIGWVGLIVPNLCRMLVGSDNRRLFPASCLVGAVFLLGVDLIARSATSAEIPIGILTAVIGAPFFALVYKKGNRVI